MRRLEPRQFQPVKSKYLLITKDYILPFLIIFAVFALWAFVFKTSYFSLQDITCERDYKPCQDPFTLAELDAHRGENIFLLKESALAIKVKEGNKTIATIKISKKLPSSLKVSITSTTPKVALKVATNGDEWVIFDDNIRAVSLESQDPNLPTVITQEAQEIQLGQEPNRAETVEALKLALEITEQFVQVTSIELEGTTVTLILEDGTQALITTRKNTATQLSTLQAILADDTIKRETNYHTVDVRYDQPVLKSE